MKVRYIFLLLWIFKNVVVCAQPSLGTEIWIEPGQSREQIFEWCRLTSETGLKDVRIFVMWTHVEPKLDQWDFEVYDWIFSACEKYGLRLQVTLNPNQPAWHYNRQYWSSIHSHAIFTDAEMKKAASKYIKHVVERYKGSKALDNWWLMNEPLPGSGATPYFIELFQQEMKKKYGDIQNLNRAWNSNFSSFKDLGDIRDLMNKEWAASMPFYDWARTQNLHLTNFQSWVHDEVMQWDSKHPFHTNPAAHLSLFHRQDAISWRPFLNSLGVSIHPTWHFGMFSLNQYTLGVSATCALGRSNAQPNPFWVSELSGGDNMFRYCPTACDLAQWTWTSIAQGADKVIYWLLNARKRGLESGEWTLLDFQNSTTERLNVVSSIAKILNSNAFFKKAVPVESRISILLSPETNLTYDRIAADDDLHLKSSMACYKSLLERGIPAQLKQIGDYDWESSENQVVILANVLTLSKSLVKSIKKFVHNGNKLIVIGPTGYYDEIENCAFLDFPFDDIFGAAPKELRTLGNDVILHETSGYYNLPVNKILCTIKNRSAIPISSYNNEITGVKNGNIIWIPSCVGLGAWENGCNDFSNFLFSEVEDYICDLPIIFNEQYDNVTMQIMRNGNSYLTVLNNANSSSITINISNKDNMEENLLYSTSRNVWRGVGNGEIEMQPNECLVLQWK